MPCNTSLIQALRVYGQIDNILINKNSGMKAEIAYSIFKKDISLSDHPFLWSKIIIGE